MRPIAAVVLTLVLFTSMVARADEPPHAAAPYCQGTYAEDLERLTDHARALERQRPSYCVRNTATYECVSYAGDGSLRRTRKKAVAHGTAFAYRQVGSDTLLLTNQHVADWPAVSGEDDPVDGVPSGCKRVSQVLAIVDNESDDYGLDDIPLAEVVSDPQLDAAVLRAHTVLPLLPWRIGKSADLRERDVVEVSGYPLGAFAATNVGKVISPYDHDDYKDWDHDDFVVDALLSAGNSGSPVLALSCATGEFELVGLYHAGYTRGSALNVAIGIDQLRDLMTTLKRPAHTRGAAELAVDLDESARRELARELSPIAEPFFPFGAQAAEVRARADGALVFAVFSSDFPFESRPVLVVEDAPHEGGFGDVARVWFGGPTGLKSSATSELDPDAQAQMLRIVEALRRDAVSFFHYRALARDAHSRADVERRDRLEQTLRRSASRRKDIAAIATDLADRLGPSRSETGATLAELVAPPDRMASASGLVHHAQPAGSIVGVQTDFPLPALAR